MSHEASIVLSPFDPCAAGASPVFRGIDVSSGMDLAVRALIEIKDGKMIVLEVFDRAYPDIVQMLLDCAQPIR